MAAAIDIGDYYRVPPDLRDLNYGKYVEEGEASISKASEYNSENTIRLDFDTLYNMLIEIGAHQY
jgi:UDP-glucose 4-epimerase